MLVVIGFHFCCCDEHPNQKRLWRIPGSFIWFAMPSHSPSLSEVRERSQGWNVKRRPLGISHSTSFNWGTHFLPSQRWQEPWQSMPASWIMGSCLSSFLIQHWTSCPGNDTAYGGVGQVLLHQSKNIKTLHSHAHKSGQSRQFFN